MSLTVQMAKHLRDVHSGGNWTVSNLKDTVAGLSWQQATTKVGSLNTIAVLVFHINYFVGALTMVLENKPLDAHDKYSFDLPPIGSQEDWEQLVHKALREAEHCASLIEKLPDNKIDEIFADKKYGNYFRNIHGLIEHTHYHLGQIAIIKKMVLEAEKK